MIFPPVEGGSGTGKGPLSSRNDPTSDKKRSKLTEEEKKVNHLASEQKRRKTIQHGLERLTELVLGLEGQARSQAAVLNRTVQFIQEQVNERRRLVEELEKRGVKVAESDKL